MSFLDLPAEIHEMFCDYLPVSDIVNFQNTCNQLKNDNFWRRLCTSRFTCVSSVIKFMSYRKYAIIISKAKKYKNINVLLNFALRIKVLHTKLNIRFLIVAFCGNKIIDLKSNSLICELTKFLIRHNMLISLKDMVNSWLEKIIENIYYLFRNDEKYYKIIAATYVAYGDPTTYNDRINYIITKINKKYFDVKRNHIFINSRRFKEEIIFEAKKINKMTPELKYESLVDNFYSRVNNILSFQYSTAHEKRMRKYINILINSSEDPEIEELTIKKMYEFIENENVKVEMSNKLGKLLLIKLPIILNKELSIEQKIIKLNIAI